MSDFINILADNLQSITQKTAILNRALVKLSVKDVFNEKDPESLNIKEWIIVIDTGLKTRLNKINTADIDNVVKNLKKVAMDNQSLILMSKV